jgi:flagellar motor switch protein FliM
VNSEHTFIAERAAAQHCPELLRRGPEPVDLSASLARMAERFARALAPTLAPLLGGEAPDIAVQPPRELSEAELVGEVGALAANSLYSTGVPGLTLLAAIEGAGLLRLVDRAFGGTGEAPKTLPAVFPLSAELMIGKLETLVAAALAKGLGHTDEAEIRALRRAAQLAELAPFPAGARIAVLRCEVTEAARAPWQLTLAVPQTLLPKLLGQGDGAPASSASPRPADPAAAPFAEVPLPLTATLVDMPVSLAAIAALEPGSVLPVAVARSVPLSIGGALVARGSVGAQDDRIALKLTQIA